MVDRTNVCFCACSVSQRNLGFFFVFCQNFHTNSVDVQKYHYNTFENETVASECEMIYFLKIILFYLKTYDQTNKSKHFKFSSIPNTLKKKRCFIFNTESLFALF